MRRKVFLSFFFLSLKGSIVKHCLLKIVKNFLLPLSKQILPYMLPESVSEKAMSIMIPRQWCLLYRK